MQRPGPSGTTTGPLIEPERNPVARDLIGAAPVSVEGRILLLKVPAPRRNERPRVDADVAREAAGIEPVRPEVARIEFHRVCPLREGGQWRSAGGRGVRRHGPADVSYRDRNHHGDGGQRGREREHTDLLPDDPATLTPMLSLERPGVGPNLLRGHTEHLLDVRHPALLPSL